MIKPNIIILAAGKGTRLEGYASGIPKGMIRLKEKPILFWHLQNIKKVDKANIVIVSGYKKESLNELNEKLIENPDYYCTNMTASLWCAKDYFENGFVMAYGDILYNPEVLAKLLMSQNDISVVVDEKWESYWSQRMGDVLDDAESLSLDEDGMITSIGQKTETRKDIKGQYIGLVYFRDNGVRTLKKIIQKELDANKLGNSFICEGKTFSELYITDVLQGLIDSGIKVKPVFINGDWIEIDTVSDLRLAEKLTEKEEPYLVVCR